MPILCFRSPSESFSRTHNFLLAFNSSRCQCHTQRYCYVGQLISMAGLILYVLSPILNVSAGREVRKNMLQSWIPLCRYLNKLNYIWFKQINAFVELSLYFQTSCTRIVFLFLTVSCQTDHTLLNFCIPKYILLCRTLNIKMPKFSHKKEMWLVMFLHMICLLISYS